jgi:hypothetical protein
LLDTIQEPAIINEKLNEVVEIEEPVAVSIKKLLESSDDDNDFLEGKFSSYFDITSFKSHSYLLHFFNSLDGNQFNRNCSRLNTTSPPNNNVFRQNMQNVFRSNTSNDTDAHSPLQTSYNAESTLPAPFFDMANVYQICSWLCANPNILLLAYNLYTSMQTPVANSFNFITPNLNSSTLTIGVPQQEDRVSVIYFC